MRLDPEIASRGCLIRRYYTRDLEFVDSFGEGMVIGLAGHSDRDVTDVQIYGSPLPGFCNMVVWGRGTGGKSNERA